ncbi:MAG: hypothetical protein MJ009_03525 [Paludibacteraceae bacterium]|nr:hypothetical protein [Paludibacteraceae bacterium]
MRKILLLTVAAMLSFAALAMPSVEPTVGSITLVFQIPEGMECAPTIQFVGDASSPAWTPGDASNPAAVTAGESGWYKIVISDAYTMGKIVPMNIDGTSGWKYQGKYHQVEGSEVPWLTIDGEGGDGEHQLVFAEGKSGGVAYLNVFQWNADPCEAANPEGEASFTVSFEIPESADPSETIVYVEGMGDGKDWGELGELLYDDRSESFSGAIDVPAGCSYKYLISYKGQGKIYMKGDNKSMPYDLIAEDEVLEWDSDPWVEPIPGGVGTFSVTFTGECLPNAKLGDKVFIAGNFEDTPEWERVYEMTQAGEGEPWSYVDLTYPDGFQFKFVVKYNDSEEELWVPSDNIQFDEMTYDFEFEGPCPTTDADEVSAFSKNKGYKFFDSDSRVLIDVNGDGSVINTLSGVSAR